MHKISWLTQKELEELIARNEKTFLFLEEYAPINRTTNKLEVIKSFDVDYSPYTALLKAYELDYNVMYTAANDYEVVGMTVNEKDNGIMD